jgi:hypothetical protein
VLPGERLMDLQIEKSEKVKKEAGESRGWL